MFKRLVRSLHALGGLCPGKVKATSSNDWPKIFTAAMVGAAGLGCPGSASSQYLPVLHLEEVFHQALPADFTPAGITIDHLGRLIAWSANDSGVLLIDQDGQQRQLRHSELRMPLALAHTVTGVEVIDRNGGTLFRFDSDGEVRDSLSLSVDGELVAAVRTDSEWYVGVRGLGGALQIISAVPDQITVSASVLGTIQRKGGDGPYSATHIRVSEAGLIVSMGDPPFEVWTIRNGHAPERLLAVDLGEILARADLDPATAHRWVGLPAVPLEGSIVLQTFADLGSDYRLLVLVEHERGVTRFRRIAAPIGFVDRVPESGLLFAVRRTVGFEIVGYSWRWEEH
jgi:hypothetical protein